MDFQSAATGEFTSRARWVRPAIANSKYPAGWPYGPNLTMYGSKFERAGAFGSTPAFPGLSTPGLSSNALFSFVGIGGILNAPVSIGTDDRITVLAPNSERLAAFIIPADGRIAGRLDSERFSGVILQKQRRAGGSLHRTTVGFRVTPVP